ncbi:MAG TPA: HAD-IB family hydrolase [Nitriliruptorales bacterium]
MSRAAAFFDLDNTIISGSSVFYFGLAAWRDGMIPTGQLVRDGWNNVTFKLFGASDEGSEAIRDRILEAVAGVEQSRLIGLTEQIIPRVLQKVRPEAKGLLDMHAAAGRDRYLISASPVELVAEVAKDLGLEGGIGTESEVDASGCYTGNLVGPFTYGPGKAEAIEKLAAEKGYDLRLSYAYSDSASDLPMLEMVGHPVAVNPDSALESVAHQRGWPIVVFARRTKLVVKTTTAVTGAIGLATGTYLLGRRHGRIQAEAAGLRDLLARRVRLR